MSNGTFYKYHGGGLKTLLSSPTNGISRTSNQYRDLTEEEQARLLEEKNYWADKIREREELS